MSNRTYDLVVLLDADAPTDTHAKIVDDAKTLIGRHGEVKATKDWGTRQLPYLIDHHEQAAYHVFQFESSPDAITNLDRGLKLTEGVLRFRIFETDPGKVLPESPPLFKREERSYERPPREASATLESSVERPAAAPAREPEAKGEQPVDPAPVDAAPVDPPAPVAEVATEDAEAVTPGGAVEGGAVEGGAVEDAAVEDAGTPAEDAPAETSEASADAATPDQPAAE